ncbi:kinase superfamily protein, putative [Medicago truncatula]|uniref:Kinase superfamily protein, putative n=1 Tax=Medicago truncatula TaxID=3880 RepID=G7JPM3_MEDTR|nr:kinase superfamily protein, putative [Medicago truncatula]
MELGSRNGSFRIPNAQTKNGSSAPPKKINTQLIIMKFKMLENSMSKDVVYQNIHDKLQLDSITKLNMTAMEEEYFGLAKICQENHSIVSILGTIGYIVLKVFRPTYGGASHKSNVCSYGMLIL